MADYYGSNYQLTDVNVPEEKIDDGEFGGRVRVAYDSHTPAVAAITTADTIYMMKIPKGARVLDVIVDIEDQGTVGTFNIGWQASAESGAEAADADGFFAALDVNSADISTRMSAQSTPSAGQLKQFSEEVQVVIVPAANTDVSTGQVISMAVEYVI